MLWLWIFFICQLVKQLSKTCQNVIHWLEWNKNTWNYLMVLNPKFFILFWTLSIVSESPVNQQNCQINGISVTWELNSTWQAVGKGHDQVTSVIHVFAQTPESRDQQFSTDSSRFFTPDFLVRFCLELVLLGVGSSEYIVANEIQSQVNYEVNDVENPFIVWVVDQIVALDWEYERNKHVVTEYQHVSELFINDVPCGKHLLFVPKIIQYIKSSCQLVAKHSQGHWSSLLDLLGQEGEVENKPENHGYSIGDKLDVEVANSWVKLSSNPEIKSKGSMSVALSWLIKDWDLVLAFEIKEDTDQNGNNVDSGP